MSIEQRSNGKQSYSPWRILVSVLATIIIVGLVMAGAFAAMTPAGQTIGNYMKWLFAADSIQIWWYVTRASGIIAYLLLCSPPF